MKLHGINLWLWPTVPRARVIIRLGPSLAAWHWHSASAVTVAVVCASDVSR
jgi:hypothetical protein